MLLIGLQYRLWFGTPNVGAVAQLRVRIVDLENLNRAVAERNRALAAQVSDLKNGLAEVEERARSELGFVGPSETFYRVVESPLSTTAHGPGSGTDNFLRTDTRDSDLGRCACGGTRDTFRRCDSETIH